MNRIPLTKKVAKFRLEFARYWLPRLEELHLVGGVEVGGGAWCHRLWACIVVAPIGDYYCWIT
jgi:hypothetical protein